MLVKLFGIRLFNYWKGNDKFWNLILRIIKSVLPIVLPQDRTVAVRTRTIRGCGLRFGRFRRSGAPLFIAGSFAGVGRNAETHEHRIHRRSLRDRDVSNLIAGTDTGGGDVASKVLDQRFDIDLRLGVLAAAREDALEEANLVSCRMGIDGRRDDVQDLTARGEIP